MYVSENLTWSRDGCSVVKLTPTHITCECWHLSVFAVTVNPQSLKVSYASSVVYSNYQILYLIFPYTKPRRYQVHTATYLFESVGSIILLLSVIIILWIRYDINCSVPMQAIYIAILIF